MSFECIILVYSLWGTFLVMQSKWNIFSNRRVGVASNETKVMLVNAPNT